MDEEKVNETPSPKTRKTSRTTRKTKIVDEDNLPVLAKESSTDFQISLEKIQQELVAIAERQKSGVSAEFNALMDGYVNKANESQTYKAKFDHLDELHEELKLDYKNQREDFKKLKSELEASQEALRMSETDLQRIKREQENLKLSYEEKVSTLVEEKEKFKQKAKELSLEKEKANQDFNNIKSDLLEQKYKAKQLEQEMQVEVESSKRNTRETNKIIDELKEKLDLRTREVEYKDALLNQLIKQVSVDDSSLTGVSTTAFNDSSQMQPLKPLVKPETSKPKLELRLDEDELEDPRMDGSSWGAFRK